VIRKYIFLSALFIFLYSTPQSNTTIEKENFIEKIAIHTAVLGGINLALGYCHELGHVLTAQAAKACNATVTSDPSTYIEVLNPLLICGHFPTFKSNGINQLISIAGPMAGIAGTWFTLKLTNIYTELKKQKTIKQAIIDGWHKPLLNHEQPKALQLLVIGHGIANIASIGTKHCSKSNQTARRSSSNDID
jgi:hypothetical protein